MKSWLLALLALVGALGLRVALAAPQDLPAVRESGVIRIALYKSYPPYSNGSGGIDYDVAAAIAKRLQVRLDPIWFEADENVDDDLRNMVWKGHYLGTGPADAMIHAPIDPELARRNDRVRFVAPYFRDRLEIVRNASKVPRMDDLSFLKDEYIGAEEASLASIALLMHEGGRFRDRVRHFRNAGDAIAAMKRGEVAAVMAQHGEAQGLVKGDAGYVVARPPMLAGPATRQWVVGMAVKSGHDALAEALEKVMTELAKDGELERIFASHGVTYLKP